MSLPNELLPVGLLGTGVTQYRIERSLRFNSSDSAYLSRTPTSAGNQKTWTWSGWLKIGKGDKYSIFFEAADTFVSDYIFLGFYFNKLRFQGFDTLGNGLGGDSLDTYRDHSAWYHVVCSVDTTQATASNRLSIYVNGTKIGFNSVQYPLLNANLHINGLGPHTIGGFGLGSNLPSYIFDGYIAEVNFIDGQALTPSSFAETNSTTGQWNPKRYTGTYGTNGFYLKFADNSNNTATTLGKDTSGNGNNWTPNNLSVTAGAGNDSLVDTPTSYGTDTGAGGEVRGNYCTLNPLNKTSVSTLANGNLSFTSGLSFSFPAATGTVNIPTSGKWYWEYTLNNAASAYAYCGIVQPLNTSKYVLYYGINGTKDVDGTVSTYGASLANGDTVGVAVDVDNNAITFYKNNVSQGAIACVTSSGLYSAVFNTGTNSQNVGLDINFGQRQWAYQAPSGFKALCDTNLPAPVVAKPNTAFDVALWTGNGSARSITGLNFNPDFVWIKGRSGATDHALYDAVRGATIDLASNSTAAETTQTQGLTAFNSDGFSLGTLAKVNTNTATYAGWAWDAGSSTATNTQGSITSQVRANANAGFSIISYTGISNGINTGTVGHGLNVPPLFIIIKRRDALQSWPVFHQSVGATSFLYLNSTNASIISALHWNNTGPTSSVFTVGTSKDVNNLNSTYIAYCFAPVAGYSSFGRYTGNGSTDGSFTYLGFLPKLILIKRTDTTSNWTILDTLREGYNVDNDPLYPNLADAEGTTDLLDINSNGFKLRTTDASVNANGGTYIYAAWASNPFQYSRAR